MEDHTQGPHRHWRNKHQVNTKLVYFLSSLRAQTAKTLIRTKSWVSADPRKSAKKCGKPRFLHKKYVKTLSFFSLVFSKIPRKTSKTPRNFLPLRALKNPGKWAENTPKDQGNPQQEKHQGNRNTKEKKDREVRKKRGFSALSGTLPKAPSRTENTTDSKFNNRSKFATAIVKTLRRTLWNHYS